MTCHSLEALGPQRYGAGSKNDVQKSYYLRAQDQNRSTSAVMGMKPRSAFKPGSVKWRAHAMARIPVPSPGLSESRPNIATNLGTVRNCLQFQDAFDRFRVLLKFGTKCCCSGILLRIWWPGISLSCLKIFFFNEISVIVSPRFSPSLVVLGHA